MNRGVIQPKVAEQKQVNATWNAKIHNKFDVEVRDAKTGRIKQRAQAFNVICNNLWSRLGSYFKYIVYSNGSGTPSSSDTTTFGTWYAVEASHHTRNSVNVATGVSYWTKYIRLAETAAVGVTITEVGIASSSSSGNLCTHAMLQDMNGNPISIKKTSTDIITIYATVYVHWSPSGQNGVCLAPALGAGTYGFGNFLDLIFGHRGVDTVSGNYSHSYAYNYVGPGTNNPPTSIGRGGGGSWNLSTKTYTYEFTRAGVDSGNVVGGLAWLSMMHASSSGESLFCTVDLRGEYEVKGESVGTGDGETTAFSTKFSLPTNATVYVDGVAQASGVTVNPHPVNTNAFAHLVRIMPQLHDGKICPIACNSLQVFPVYYYNPLHELGLYSWTRARDNSSYYNVITLAFSDDLVNWSSNYSPKIVPEQYRHCKYIRMQLLYSSSSISASTSQESGAFPPEVSAQNIVFDEPPASGSVITIDYTTPFVPKDTDHVYDLSIAIQFGEYTGEGE